MQSPPTAPQTHPELAALLEEQHHRIISAWLELLNDAWGEGDPRTTAFRAGLADRLDLLSCLIQSLLTGSVAENFINAIVERLQLSQVSLADFLEEKSCLLTIINEVISDATEMKINRRGIMLPFLRMQQMSDRILARSAIVYEQVIKHGGRAFCQIDDEGVIIYANPEMLRLSGTASLAGQPLAPLFDKQDHEFISQALAPRPTPTPMLRVLTLQPALADPIPVGIELAPIMILDRHVGGYASMVDISGPMAGLHQVMEQTPLGIIRINAKHEVTYANPRAREMTGATGPVRGIPVERLFPDPKNLAIFQREARKRFENGQPSEYPVEITRIDDGRPVPVMIAATPERDPRGTIIGSMAIIRSMELEKANEDINFLIATCLNTEELVHKVAAVIGGVCPFDMLTVSVYSKKLHHVRSLFSQPKQQSRFRWWLMPPGLSRWVQSKQNDYIDDLEDFLAGPEWVELRQAPEIAALVQSGLHSITRCLVWDREEGEETRLVASLALFRQGKRAFSAEDRKRLKSLPLVKTVLAALHLEEKRKLAFRFDLVKKIFNACDDMKNVADLITADLVAFYGWNNVSIFRIDEKKGKFCLLSQKAKDNDAKYLLPPDYEQPFDQGVLGQVWMSGKPVFTGNVRNDPHIKPHYVNKYKGESNSELCMPIMALGMPFWLINIEDPLENAFSSDEVAELQLVHGEIGAILERAFQHHFLQETLKYASDAILVIDSAWRIRRFNPAVKKLLGYPDTEMDSLSLETLFVDQGIPQWLKQGKQIPGQETELRHQNGETVTVYLSTTELPPEIGGMVLIARDLRAVKRLEELDYLGKLYYEIAVQTKTPLSLLFSWLKRMQGELSPEERRDTLGKAIKQLRKLTLTYDRLALYDKEQGLVPYQPLLFDIGEILELLPEEFPRTEWQKVVVEQERNLPLLRGDLFQLSFCLETILSYLLRTASEEGVVTLRVGRQEDKLVVALRGSVPELPDSAAELGTQASVQLTETIADMALGDKVIRSFVVNQGGTYALVREGNDLVFTIELKSSPERSML